MKSLPIPSWLLVHLLSFYLFVCLYNLDLFIYASIYICCYRYGCYDYSATSLSSNICLSAFFYYSPLSPFLSLSPSSLSLSVCLSLSLLSFILSLCSLPLTSPTLSITLKPTLASRTKHKPRRKRFGHSSLHKRFIRRFFRGFVLR